VTDSASPSLQTDDGGRPLLFSLFMTSIGTLHFVIPDAFELAYGLYVLGSRAGDRRNGMTMN